MSRYIKLANQKNRDAEVTFKSLNPKPKIKMVMENGEKVVNKRVVKSTSEKSLESLFLKYDEKPQEGVDFQKQLAAKLSEDLINSDPELDINLHGKFISEVSRVYINEGQKPVFRVKKVEKIIPEKITTPIVNRLASPGPDPMINGTTPTIVDKDVIRIGLKRSLHALITAFSIF